MIVVEAKETGKPEVEAESRAKGLEVERAVDLGPEGRKHWRIDGVNLTTLQAQNSILGLYNNINLLNLLNNNLLY